MTFKRPYSAGLTALAVGLFAATAAYAEPTVNKGDNAWMLTSTVLVLLMTIPGLALFYGGLVRSKNMLSVLMQVFYCVCVVTLLWALYGYSLAFTGGSDFIGGFSKAFLMGVTPDSKAATFSVDANITELIYVTFQMTFACITPALIVGAFAERMKFSAVLLFIVLWFTFAYLPLAHMVWFWAGPDAYTLSQANLPYLNGILGESTAAKFLADYTAAATDQAKAEVLSALGSALGAANGYLFNLGALDFAGGTVVHVNAGVAGLVCALVLGPRVGFGREPMAPHNLALTFIGACLLWVGWYGFNAGSNLEANGLTALVVLNTTIATAAAALAWSLGEYLTRGHASLLGAASGAVAGLVGITPACGWVGPAGAIVVGIAAGFLCLWAVVWLKRPLGYADAPGGLRRHGLGRLGGGGVTRRLLNP